MSNYRNSSYNNRNRRKRYRGASDDWLVILLYYILPFVIVNGIIFFAVTARPKCTVTVGETNDYLSTQVTVKIDSWFPTKSISVTMAGEEIELEKVKGRTYKTTVYKNGSLQIKVENVNGMSLSQFAHVDMLDDMPPTIEQSDVEEGIITITFSDSQSGINLDSIYALDSADNRVEPLSLDRNTATAVFVGDSAGLYIFAEDKAGNVVKGTFTSHKEDEEGTLQSEENSEDEEGEPATVQ